VKEFKEGNKVLLFNSKFKIFGKGKMKSNWDGPYVVHSVSPSGVESIIDIKGDQYVVSGQQLNVFLEPMSCPSTTLTYTPWRTTPSAKPKT
jgi:hypothetical protein